jgi:hypothetical protein
MDLTPEQIKKFVELHKGGGTRCLYRRGNPRDSEWGSKSLSILFKASRHIEVVDNKSSSES